MPLVFIINFLCCLEISVDGDRISIKVVVVHCHARADIRNWFILILWMLVLGWRGADCQTDIDECQKVVCQNGGACINQPGSFQCACTLGTRGKFLLCQHPCMDCEYCCCTACKLRVMWELCVMLQHKGETVLYKCSNIIYSLVDCLWRIESYGP